MASSSVEGEQLNPMAPCAMGTDWTKDRIQLLISVYANEELLWNTSSDEYNHKERRREALARIASAMDLPVSLIRKRLKHIRGYYIREVRKTSRDGHYKSRWPLFKILNSFLHEHILRKKSSLEIESLDNSATDVDEDSDEREDLHAEDFRLLMGQPTIIKSPQNSHESKRHNSDLENHLSKKLKLIPSCADAPQTTPSSASNSHLSHLEDPDELFGRHVVNELQLIKDMRAKQFAKLQIHNILFNAQFGLAAVPRDIDTKIGDSSTRCTDKIMHNGK